VPDARLGTHLSFTRSPRVRSRSPLGRGRLSEGARHLVEARRLLHPREAARAGQRGDPMTLRSRGRASATRRNDANFDARGVRSGLARFPRATRGTSRSGRPAQRHHASNAPDRRTELCLDVEIPLDARLETHLPLTRSRRVRTVSPHGRRRLAERRALEERRLHLFPREPGLADPRPAITTQTSRDTECGRVLPVFCAQLGALRAPTVPRSAAEPRERSIDGRSCASTSRFLSTRGSGRTSASRARGAFGRSRLSGVAG
jgi:hypothetical protein